MGARVPKGIFTCPSRENLITIETLHKEYPAGFASFSGDKFVLHAGGCCFRVAFLCEGGSIILHPELERILLHTVSIFVLDTNFIIWAPKLRLGLEVPFEHGQPRLLEESGREAVLELVLKGSELMHNSSGGPILLRLRKASPEEVTPEDIEPDLRSMIPQDSSLRLIYAMYRRWLHFYESTDGEELPTSGDMAARSLSENFLLDANGDADDLGADELLSEGEAGMNVLMELLPVGSMRRLRDGDGASQIKTRRLE